MYQPSIGKFLSEDPMQFLADDPNLGRYVANNPTNLIDPTGLMEQQAANVSKEVKEELYKWTTLIKGVEKSFQQTVTQVIQGKFGETTINGKNCQYIARAVAKPGDCNGARLLDDTVNIDIKSTIAQRVDGVTLTDEQLVQTIQHEAKHVTAYLATTQPLLRVRRKLDADIQSLPPQGDCTITYYPNRISSR